MVEALIKQHECSGGMTMKKSVAALASLITVAGLTGGTTLTAQAHPVQPDKHVPSTSQVAASRLHSLRRPAGIQADQGNVRPGEGGAHCH
jgi:hypothetical protein